MFPPPLPPPLSPLPPQELDRGKQGKEGENAGENTGGNAGGNAGEGAGGKPPPPVFARGSDVPPTLRRDAGLLADALSFHKSWQVRE